MLELQRRADPDRQAGDRGSARGPHAPPFRRVLDVPPVQERLLEGLALRQAPRARRVRAILSVRATPHSEVGFHASRSGTPASRHREIGGEMAQLPNGLQITWLGHATFLIQTQSGKRILVDPWGMGNPACPDDHKDVGDLDAMLITHAHFDHIGDAVEIGKATGAQIVSIPETSHWLGSKGLENLLEMNKGGTVEVAGCRV